MPVHDLMHNAVCKMGADKRHKGLFIGKFFEEEIIGMLTFARSLQMIGINNAYFARYLFLTYGALHAHSYQISSCSCEWGCCA